MYNFKVQWWYDYNYTGFYALTSTLMQTYIAINFDQRIRPDDYYRYEEFKVNVMLIFKIHIFTKYKVTHHFYMSYNISSRGSSAFVWRNQIMNQYYDVVDLSIEWKINSFLSISFCVFRS